MFANVYQEEASFETLENEVSRVSSAIERLRRNRENYSTLQDDVEKSTKPRSRARKSNRTRKNRCVQ